MHRRDPNRVNGHQDETLEHDDGEYDFIADQKAHTDGDTGFKKVRVSRRELEKLNKHTVNDGLLFQVSFFPHGVHRQLQYPLFPEMSALTGGES